jgi:hypothetical protein
MARGKKDPDDGYDTLAESMLVRENGVAVAV